MQTDADGSLFRGRLGNHERDHHHVALLLDHQPCDPRETKQERERESERESERARQRERQVADKWSPLHKLTAHSSAQAEAAPGHTWKSA